MSDTTRRFVAVYWDFENIHKGVPNELKHRGMIDIKSMLEYINTLGEVSINKVFANFVDMGLDRYRYQFMEHSMDLIQIFARVMPTGEISKNGADIRIAIDAVEDAFNFPKIETFVIISGDSDFTHLAQMLRKHGKYVVGIGAQNSTSQFWIKSVNEFKFYHNIVAQDTPQRGPRVQPSGMEKAKRLLLQAIKRLTRGSLDGKVERTAIKPIMLRLDPTFDETSLGYNSFTKFLEGCNDLVEISRGKADVEVTIRDAAAAVQALGAANFDAAPAPAPAAGERRPAALAPVAPVVSASGEKLGPAKTLLVQAVGECMRGKLPNERITSTQVKNVIHRLDPSFDYMNYGYKKFHEFLKDCQDVITMERARHGDYVALRDPNAAAVIVSTPLDVTVAPVVDAEPAIEPTRSRGSRPPRRDTRNDRPEGGERSGRGEDRRRDRRQEFSDDETSDQAAVLAGYKAPALSEAGRDAGRRGRGGRSRFEVREESAAPALVVSAPTYVPPTLPEPESGSVAEYTEYLTNFGFPVQKFELRQSTLLIAYELLKGGQKFTVAAFEKALQKEFKEKGIDAAEAHSTRVVLEKSWVVESGDTKGSIVLRKHIQAPEDVFKSVDRAVLYRLGLVVEKVELVIVAELLYLKSVEFVEYLQSVQTEASSLFATV